MGSGFPCLSLGLVFSSWKLGQAFLSFGFLSNSPHLNNWHLLGLYHGLLLNYIWLLQLITKSWVTLGSPWGWMLPLLNLLDGFAGCFPLLPKGHVFWGSSSLVFLSRAGEGLSSTPGALPVCCEEWWARPLVLSLLALLGDPGIPLCLPKPNTKVQIESSCKTMLFILF